MAPAASAMSISATLAQSKDEPSSARSFSTSGAGIGLDRVEDAAVRQRARESVVVLAHDVEVDDEAGAFGSSVAKKVADTVGHSRALPKRSG